MKHAWIFAIQLILALGLTGCLKTRAQLRDAPDDREESRPQSVPQARDVQSSGQYVIEEIKAEITQLSGRLEEMERTQKEGQAKAQGADRDSTKKLEERMGALETELENLAEAMKKLQEAPVSQDSNSVFEKAKARFAEEDFSSAAETFGTYLKLPKIKHAEEATFLRAESLFKLKQYKKAIVDYSKIQEKFARSKHMPQALYKIGLSFENIGMKEDAKGFYQELIEKFPKSAEAKKVRNKVR